VAAAWFHDLVNLPKNDPNRSEAARLSAEAARPVLLAEGFPKATLPSVAHAIEAHSFSAGAPPETTEAAILRDADCLDALGANGIARIFHVAGSSGTPSLIPTILWPPRATWMTGALR